MTRFLCRGYNSPLNGDSCYRLSKSILSVPAVALFALFLILVNRPIMAEAKTISTETQLTQDTTYNEDLYVNAPLDLNGHKLTVNGNVVATANVRIADNAGLTVKGNYIQKSGSLSNYGGMVNVSGNFAFCKFDNSGNPAEGTGYYISNYLSVANVDGDIIIFSSGFENDSFGGTINLCGDYTDLTGVRAYIVNLKGAAQQYLDLSENSYLGSFYAKNTDIRINEYFSAKLESDLSLKANKNPVILHDVSLNGNKLTVPCSANISGVSGGDLTIKGNCTVFGERGYYLGVLNVSGNMEINSDGSIGGDTLSLKGNYTDNVGVNCSFDRFKLTGTTQQYMKLKKGSYINNIYAKNTDIKVNGYFGGSLLSNLELKTDKKKIIFNRVQTGKYKLTVPCPVETADAISVGEGGKLTVNGSVVAKDSVGVQGDLTVTGDYTQAKGSLGNSYYNVKYISKIKIGGDLNVCGLSSTGEKIKSDSSINISNAPSVKMTVSVDGNVFVNSKTNCYLSELNLKGNYTEKSGGLHISTLNLLGGGKQKLVKNEGSVSELYVKKCLSMCDIPLGYAYNLYCTHYEISKEPTAKDKGVLLSTCSICKANKQKTIPIKNGVQPNYLSVKYQYNGENSGAILYWGNVEGVDKYIVFRKSGGKWKQIGETARTGFTDKSGKESSFYTVLCMKKDGTVLYDYNHEGKCSYSTEMYNISVENTDKGVKISYDAVRGAEKYRVFRAERPIMEYKPIGTTTSTSFTDKTAVPGKYYIYYVRALNGKGQYITVDGGVRREIQYYAPGPKVTAEVNLDGIRLEWTKMSRAVKYRVFYSTYNSRNEQVWVKLATVKSETSYLDTTLKRGDTRTYSVVGMDEKGRLLNEYNSAYVSVTRSIPWLEVSAKNVASGIKITWKEVEGAAKYRIYGNKYGSQNALKTIKAGEALAYTDTNVRQGEYYRYTVAALTAGGTVISEGGIYDFMRREPVNAGEILGEEISSDDVIIVYEFADEVAAEEDASGEAIDDEDSSEEIVAGDDNSEEKTDEEDVSEETIVEDDSSKETVGEDNNSDELTEEDAEEVKADGSSVEQDIEDGEDFGEEDSSEELNEEEDETAETGDSTNEAINEDEENGNEEFVEEQNGQNAEEETEEMPEESEGQD